MTCLRGIMKGMININNEGPTVGYDLDQENVLLLKEAEIALGKLEIKKLELENLGVDDFMTKTELKRLEDEIKKHEDLIVSLGGEKEVKE